jgi:hypothetical protein
MRTHRFAPKESKRRNEMTKTAFAVAIAALLMLAVSGTSQAVPIAPLTGVNSTDNGGVTPVFGIPPTPLSSMHFLLHIMELAKTFSYSISSKFFL